jgi:SM-20-related protein
MDWMTAIVNDLATQGYSIQHQVLPHALFTALADECQQQPLRPAKIGSGHIEMQHNTIRSDLIAWLDEQHLSTAQQQYLAYMEQLRLAINQQLYLGLFDFECHYASYPAGSFYRKHVDQFRNNNSRQISVIYYLNRDWQSAFGGQLKLYNPQDQLLAEHYPTGNSLVCFLSDQFPHEVCETSQTRMSLTGWFRRRS